MKRLKNTGARSGKLSVESVYDNASRSRKLQDFNFSRPAPAPHPPPPAATHQLHEPCMHENHQPPYNSPPDASSVHAHHKHAPTQHPPAPASKPPTAAESKPRVAAKPPVKAKPKKNAVPPPVTKRHVSGNVTIKPVVTCPPASSADAPVESSFVRRRVSPPITPNSYKLPPEVGNRFDLSVLDQLDANEVQGPPGHPSFPEDRPGRKATVDRVSPARAPHVEAGPHHHVNEGVVEGGYPRVDNAQVSLKPAPSLDDFEWPAPPPPIFPEEPVPPAANNPAANITQTCFEEDMDTGTVKRRPPSTDLCLEDLRPVAPAGKPPPVDNPPLDSRSGVSGNVIHAKQRSPSHALNTNARDPLPATRNDPPQQVVFPPSQSDVTKPKLPPKMSKSSSVRENHPNISNHTQPPLLPKKMGSVKSSNPPRPTGWYKQLYLLLFLALNGFLYWKFVV